MKLKYKILILIGVIVIVFIFIIALPNKYENNKLYSEKHVMESTPDNFVDGESISREKAITKALDIFKNGFKIELDRKNLLESVYLYNTNEGPEWSITWTESPTQNKYYCNIVASNGDITFAGYNKPIDSNIADKEALQKILKPLVDELGIDISNSDYYYTENNTIQFVEKKDKELYVHDFSIDFNNKKINYYQRSKVNNGGSKYEDTRGRR